MKNFFKMLVIVFCCWLLDDSPLDVVDRIDYYSHGRFIYTGHILCEPDYYPNGQEYFVVPQLPLGMQLTYGQLGNFLYPSLLFLGRFDENAIDSNSYEITNVHKLYLAKDRIIAQNADGWYQVTDNWPKAVKVEPIPALPPGPYQKIILFKPVLWKDEINFFLSESHGSLDDTILPSYITCIQKITEYSFTVVKGGKYTKNHRIMGKTAFSHFIIDLDIGVPRWVDQETFEHEIQLALKETKRLEWKTSYYAEARESDLKGLTRNDSQAFEVIVLEQAKSPSAP